MLLPMSPTSSLFLLAETREAPMHVGSLQLFEPPPGADALDLRAMFDAALADSDVAPIFTKRARRSVGTLGQWAWDVDRAFDLEHHVRRSALPRPGRARELLALCSRLHSTLLDRHRPLWEMHLVEGLHDGRYAIYFKVHHALMDGVSALRLLESALSADPAERGMPPLWARPRSGAPVRDRGPGGALHVRKVVAETAGMVPAFGRTLARALREQTAAMSFSAPRTILNVPITGARRFAAQSWPMERIKAVGRKADATVNDVVLAMCSGALRAYLSDLDALPEVSLIAMVPVSLAGKGPIEADGGGNAVGVVMCRLGTDRSDPADRLATVHGSMEDGKHVLHAMTPTQILAMSALGIAPLAVLPALQLTGRARPPFNLVISNLAGPREPKYWNGARLNGLYPLSIPLNGQALNITCTSYATEVGFGLVGCRRTVPRLQRLLGDLDDELNALEKAVGA